jgi:hypothetical protein
MCVMEQNCSSAQISPSLSLACVPLQQPAAAQREKWRCRNLQPMKFHPAPASPAFQPARDQGGYLISKTVARALTRALLNQEKRLRKRDGQSFSTTWCASEPSESGRPAARFCDNPLCADRSDQVTRLIYSTARSCGYKKI